MAERTNEEWLADLSTEGLRRAEALEDLRVRLERGVFYYLRSDRSDLSDRPAEELQQMAQDFTQEALLKVLDNLESFRGESRFTTWAAKIATREAISELRRVRYRNYSLDHLTENGRPLPSITELAVTPEGAPAPEDAVERGQVLHVVDEAINSVLTERQRLALTAYTIDGITIDELAWRMDTNRNALYKLLHDARVKLKRHLEAQGLSLDYILGLFEQG